METKELERLILENLKIARENRDYIKKIDRRQRWSRNWAVFYWAVIIIAGMVGYFYAFPYLQDIRETVIGTWDQISAFASFTEQIPQ